jgi:hypothetical protein
MSKNILAKDVLVKARDELVNEIAACGANGGVGRSQSYAPVLVNIQNAIDVLDGLDVSTVDRMAAVRAAKKQQTQG